MKKIILLLFVSIIAFSSCEDIQDNGSVIQATIDSVFFKSFDARGSRLDNEITLQGFTNDEVLTLHLESFQLGDYELGGSRTSFATFENSNGNIYSTNPLGSGTIKITDRCISCGWLTGTFNFNAVLPGIDTIAVEKGVFFEVFFGGETDAQDPANAGSFSARVNDVPFSPITVTAIESGNSILIAGATASSSILIRLPLDVENGNQPLPENGYQANYTINATPENAVEGNISIITHDTANKIISGTFAFNTENYMISSGQFNVTY